MANLEQGKIHTVFEQAGPVTDADPLPGLPMLERDEVGRLRVHQPQTGRVVELLSAVLVELRRIRVGMGMQAGEDLGQLSAADLDE